MQKSCLIVLLFLITSACHPQHTPIPQKSDKASLSSLQKGEIQQSQFSDWSGPAIPIWTFIPKNIDLHTASIIFVMHGGSRNADEYIKEWKKIAIDNGLIVIAPEFSKKTFPKSASYSLGKVFTNIFNNNVVQSHDESQWTFSAIEPIFDYVVKQLNGTQTNYLMYGHSAGAQFAHRFLFYKPNARVKRIISANAGFYTLPDLTVDYPYGLKGSGISENSLIHALSTEMVVLLGEKDNDINHKGLLRSPLAMQQGQHRLERGITFYKAAQTQAKNRQLTLPWQIKIVPGVGHSNSGMAISAQPFLN